MRSAPPARASPTGQDAPRKAGRCSWSPQTAVVIDTLAVVAVALLPAAALVCAAGGLGTPGGMGVHGACPGGPSGPIRAGLYGAAAVWVGTLLVHASRLAIAARRAGRLLPRDAAVRKVAGCGEPIWVVSSERVVACSVGWPRPRALVTTGLLQGLSPPERAAVMEHEAAHVRFGHPGLAVLGAAVAAAGRGLPPADAAWRRLRRDLEVAADDAAAGRLGPGPVVTALAKVALARSASMGVGFGDGEDLRYRLERLRRPRPGSRSARWPGTTVALGLSGLLAGGLCLTLAGGVEGVGALVCGMVLVGVVWRPARPGGSGITRLVHHR